MNCHLALRHLEISLELHISGFHENEQHWFIFHRLTLWMGWGWPSLDGVHAFQFNTAPRCPNTFINYLPGSYRLNFATPRIVMSSGRFCPSLKSKMYTLEMSTFRHGELGIYGADTAFWLLAAIQLGASRRSLRILSAVSMHRDTRKSVLYYPESPISP